eukprot:NODE_1279_length_1493_cov_5.801939_g1063_i0.p1 GENE.NODE_1279_length_1493_cov_5.801939_g1063_i0~~NODE_1279_length_1493_cov_5.801939_g1063_i0.p1  ORF type:complete len:450 (+),score=110.02 NODE_1279_length_1493_cov_5.801939_g1063_i0:72-1421(+)
MALHSLFILNRLGEVLIEKHWRGKIARSVAEDFWTTYVTKASAPTEVLPVLQHGKYYLIHYICEDLTFLAALTAEAPPLMTLSLLERITQTFKLYFNAHCNEESIKENFVTVYQLLAEMVDNGYPVTTEPSVLKDLVPPPTFLNKAQSIVDRVRESSEASSSASSDMGKGRKFGANISSDVMWRKRGVQYSNNEIFFDLVEELDAIFDVNGQIVESKIYGSIECNSRLSGMPDVHVSFLNPSILDDCAFHPCVRYAKYEQDRSLSFIPPDGHFSLMTYRVAYNGNVPFYVKPTVSINPGADGGRIGLMVGTKPGEGLGEQGVQDVVVTITLPRNASAPRFEMPGSSSGPHAKVNPTTNTLRWEVGRVTPNRTPSMTVIFSMPSVSADDDKAFSSMMEGYDPACMVDFKLPMTALSGLRIESVHCANEKYKPYKGVRAITRAGQFHVRTS